MMDNDKIDNDKIKNDKIKIRTALYNFFTINHTYI